MLKIVDPSSRNSMKYQNFIPGLNEVHYIHGAGGNAYPIASL